MRIWHEALIPKLCRQHLLAMWREGLGCYKIITEDKKGYRNHPAVKEFENNTLALMLTLHKVRDEMINRHYHPKQLPTDHRLTIGAIKEWQTLDQQIEILKNKHCECRI